MVLTAKQANQGLADGADSNAMLYEVFFSGISPFLSAGSLRHIHMLSVCLFVCFEEEEEERRRRRRKKKKTTKKKKEV